MTNEEKKTLIEECDRLFSYDPESGIVTRKIRSSNALAGSEVGCLRSDGYLRVSVMNKKYQLHRIIFLMVKGYMPKEIDHINGIENDNRWSNLREVTGSQNGMNKPMPKTNTSGVLGVTWKPRDRKWAVQMGLNGKCLYFGQYADFELAELVSREAREKYFGEYIRKPIEVQE